MTTTATPSPNNESVPTAKGRLKSRKLILWSSSAILLLLTTFALLIFGFSFGTHTVLEEETAGEYDSTYGFSVQQPFFQFHLIGPRSGPDGITIKFWTRRGSRNEQAVELTTSRLVLKTVKEHVWTNSQSTVLIGLNVDIDLGSYSTPSQKWLLYDFRSGTLSACGPLNNDNCAAFINSARTD